MLNAALGCFSLAAILGIILLIYILTDKKPPLPIALLHGGFALSGLILLTIHAIEYMNMAWIFVGFFLLVALFGIYLFMQKHSRKSELKALALGHGAVAILGLIILVVFSTMK